MPEDLSSFKKGEFFMVREIMFNTAYEDFQANKENFSMKSNIAQEDLHKQDC